MTGYYQMIQEYPSVNAWNDLQGISFRSNTIPVVPENLTGVSAEGQVLQANSSGYQIIFITDFEPNDSNISGGLRQALQYYPLGEYRLTDMTNTSTPLTTIDLTVYWTDVYGNLHDIYIPPASALTIKILFRKRSFYGL